MTGKQFKISVVIPVYNVELYVAETIESVIRQDIGFEENVQIVLVNDGSPDGSGQICEEYAKRYPENIQYVYQENAGVSVARNTGMDYSFDLPVTPYKAQSQPHKMQFPTRPYTFYPLISNTCSSISEVTPLPSQSKSANT